jgi:hypothetical protein
MLAKQLSPTMFALILGVGYVGAFAQDTTDGVSVPRGEESVLKDGSSGSVRLRDEVQEDPGTISSDDAPMSVLPYMIGETLGSCGASFEHTCGQIDGRRRFETELPGLFGIYGCYFGYPPHHSSFDLGDQFLAIDGAWLCVKGGTDGGPACALARIDLDEPEVQEASLSLTEEALSCDSLMYVEAVLEGVGWIGLSLDPYGCSDCCSYVLEGTMCVDGVAAHGPLSLFGFGHFQNCFGGDGVMVHEQCDSFDVDGDGDVDIRDAALLYAPATAP